MAVRIDKWLWAVRAYKTRSDASEACRSNRVSVNGTCVKPSREVREGDRVSFKKMPVTYTYEVLDAISNRQPAKNVPLYVRNLTPQSELDKLTMPHESIFITRDRGTGRPTKKDRRDIDSLMEGFCFEDDSEESSE